MGWIGDMWENPRGKEELKDYFENHLTRGNKIIDCSIKRNVFYAAVKKGEEVWALVVYFGYKTTRYKTHQETEFLYKMNDETVGPWARECPKRIIKKLTPTESDWANQWRRACLGLPQNEEQLSLF